MVVFSKRLYNELKTINFYPLPLQELCLFVRDRNVQNDVEALWIVGEEGRGNATTMRKDQVSVGTKIFENDKVMVID